MISYKGDRRLFSTDIPPYEIRDLLANRLLQVDDCGNLNLSIPLQSLNLKPGDAIYVRIGNSVNRAIFTDNSLTVPEGVLAFSFSSAMWLEATETNPTRWSALLLRGGNAWELYGCPPLGALVSLLEPWEEVFSGYRDSFSWSV